MADPLKTAKQYAAYNNSLYQANTRQAQAFNAAEAAKNRDWQERLSNSAHQREVADLKKAGLNPVLSSNLAGASTGSGASASSDAANVDTSMPQAIVDMAEAQLNSATQLQTTAMTTQANIAMNALDNATKTNNAKLAAATDVLGILSNFRLGKYKHDTSSGDSWVGQFWNLGKTPKKSTLGMKESVDWLYNAVGSPKRSDWKKKKTKVTPFTTKSGVPLKQNEYRNIDDLIYAASHGGTDKGGSRRKTYAKLNLGSGSFGSALGVHAAGARARKKKR